MNTDSNGKLSLPIDEGQIDRILDSTWEAAARINPHLLARLRPDYKFKRLRAMIKDCLGSGLSETETHQHCLQELLQSAQANRQPKDTCSDTDDAGGSRR